jgi:nitrate/nitrite transporter NarK
VTADSPAQHPTIHPHERKYIQSSLNAFNELESSDYHAQASASPWKTFFSSRCVWAMLIAGFANTFGFYEMLSELPSYLSGVYGVSAQRAGVLCMFPYTAIALTTISAGFTADALIGSSVFKRIHVRKLMMVIGTVFPSIFLFLVPEVHDVTSVIAILTVALACYGFSNAGLNPLIIEIGGAHTATLYAIYSTMGQISGLITPILTSLLLTEMGKRDGFHTAFRACACMYLITVATWVVMASDKPLVYTRLPNRNREVSIFSTASFAP